VKAGFEVVEIHAAHGYLLHEFLSPLSNRRTDQFGGSLENRMRFPLAIAAAVRNKVPESLPVFVRISATDWVEGGWNIEQSIEFCRRLKEIGIDLIDVSSGGNVPDAKIAIGPGYQVPFARDIRNGAEITTAAVGMITEPAQAEEILQKGEADAIFIAREFLREPYLPLRAAAELGGDVNVPRQYGRAIQVKRMRAADGR
jgi:2,4-dienoyl-CoA reductase-like NADH-dependent reductase (Old Yellow Enzyme family)